MRAMLKPEEEATTSFSFPFPLTRGGGGVAATKGRETKSYCHAVSGAACYVFGIVCAREGSTSMRRHKTRTHCGLKKVCGDRIRKVERLIMRLSTRLKTTTTTLAFLRPGVSSFSSFFSDSHFPTSDSTFLSSPPSFLLFAFPSTNPFLPLI